jgi:thioredoxin type arsenate reductase
MAKKLVLFVCTHNSARSQMAEGLLRARHGDRYRAASAGTAPFRVHPLAVEAMREVGVDLAGHRSKHVDEFVGADGATDADYVVTVCDSAREACPFIPARVRNLHRRFSDPSEVTGTDEERLAAFRRVRDEIAAWVDATFGAPPVEPAAPEELPAVVALLAASGLPHADLTPGHLAHFRVARDGRTLAGVVGLEVFGRAGLLRSLAVVPEARGTGLGGRLVAAVEADARALGLEALYLLTTTAAPFFAARGYAPTDVPSPLGASAEFAALCPSTAPCFSKPLA